MSRIGNAPIEIPAAVTINLTGQKVSVNGPKGQLELQVRSEIKLKLEGNVLTLSRAKQDRLSRSLHGLYRSLLFGMVKGVTEGWTKNLEMVGVGYRAGGGGDKISLSVGYSHPVEMIAPEGISFTVTDNTKIQVSGIDKTLVGQVAANLRSVRPPEVYKGKGIRYLGELVRRKPGKAGKAVGAK